MCIESDGDGDGVSALMVLGVCVRETVTVVVWVEKVPTSSGLPTDD